MPRSPFQLPLPLPLLFLTALFLTACVSSAAPAPEEGGRQEAREAVLRLQASIAHGDWDRAARTCAPELLEARRAHAGTPDRPTFWQVDRSVILPGLAKVWWPLGPGDRVLSPMPTDEGVVVPLAHQDRQGKDLRPRVLVLAFRGDRWQVVGTKNY